MSTILVSPVSRSAIAIALLLVPRSIPTLKRASILGLFVGTGKCVSGFAPREEIATVPPRG